MGNTTKMLGAAPKLHCSTAPLQTCNGMGALLVAVYYLPCRRPKRKTQHPTAPTDEKNDPVGSGEGRVDGGRGVDRQTGGGPHGACGRVAPRGKNGGGRGHLPRHPQAAALPAGRAALPGADPPAAGTQRRGD